MLSLLHYQEMFSFVMFVVFLDLLFTQSSPTMTATTTRSRRGTVIPAANGATDLDTLGSWKVTRVGLSATVSDWEGRDRLISVATPDELIGDTLVGTAKNKIYLLKLQ